MESNKHYFFVCKFYRNSDNVFAKYLSVILTSSFLVIIISPLLKMKKSLMQSILLLRIAVDSPEFQAKSNVTSEWYLSFDIVLPRLHMHRRPIKLILLFFSLLCTTSDHYPPLFFFFNPDFFHSYFLNLSLSVHYLGVIIYFCLM